MTLFSAILGFGIILAVAGVLCLLGNERVASACKTFPRHKLLGYVLFGAGALWFLWNIAHLSQADEIGFLSRDMMLLIFAAIGLLSIPFVPDFLAVRGLAILYLLFARVALDAGWLQYSTPQRLFNFAIYIGIVGALIIGASPFRLRDFFNWLFAAQMRHRIMGGVCVAYGLILTFSAFQL